MKKRTIVLAMAVALGLPAVASAAVTVCPTGGGTCYAGMNGLDWSESNIMADDGNLAVYNFQQEDGSVKFQVYGQGTLANFNGIGVVPTGLNTAWTWTYVLGFGEKVTAVGAGGPGEVQANFQFDPDQDLNFWEVYYTPITAGPLSPNTYEGTGFNTGTKVFSGRFTGFRDVTGLVPTRGDFAIAVDPNGAPIITQFDQSPVAGDPASATGLWATSGPGGSPTQTVLGSGSNDPLVVAVDYINPAFIQGVIDSYILNNVSQTLPFNATLAAALGGALDPSLRFVTAAGGAAPVLFGPGAVGLINGFPLGVLETDPGGDDIQFQSDFNSTLTGRVPEPGTLMLLGLGLAGLGTRFARRKG